MSEPASPDRIGARWQQPPPETKPAPSRAGDRLRRAMGRATEAHVLFPMIALVALVGIWVTTATMIQAGSATARRAANGSSRELVATYQAQVTRAVHEIDVTLKLVVFAAKRRSDDVLLRELRNNGLLPPELLFTVSITDAEGRIKASTRPHATASVGDADFFKAQQRHDLLTIGRPTRETPTADWRLAFSRRLNNTDGSFAGIVFISVDASYFVSGYESSRLGEHGVLGLLGDDGIFRVLRSGDRITAGESADYRSIVPVADDSTMTIAIVRDSWDGVRRYTATDQLYDLPIAVVVGLSEDEQLEPARIAGRRLVWEAATVSVLLLAVVAVLGTMSRQLARARKLAADEERAHSGRVEYLAYHDGLTGLPNRSLFSELLGRGIELARRQRKQSAVLFLDLDRFKQINDTLGHEAGDALLKEVAQRLKGCLRASDTVARLGGDEFVVLLLDLDDEHYVASVARKILLSVAQPFMLVGQEFRVTASVGISLYPRDGEDEQTLKKNADIAMYEAKEEGKNTFKFYSKSLNANSLERLALDVGLRHALERDQFELHYQVKRAIISGHVAGMEALLRWQHPDLGTVAPLKFLPVAEETGMIVPIGKWVLNTACLQSMAWQRQGLPGVSMAVNLCARQFFDANLVADLQAIIESSGIDPQLLELEIGENLLMGDVDRTLGVLASLRTLGVRVAIDDFGIGYSSLSALKRFPLDTIKIDRSVIRDMASMSDHKELTEAIIAVGRSLSLTVVAQGVETKEQADFLRSHACDQMQGFYLDKPLPADRVVHLLREQSVDRHVAERHVEGAPAETS